MSFAPPSRSTTSTSFLGGSGSTSNSRPMTPTASVADFRPEHTTTSLHKFRNIFSSQPSAYFQANVTIHELANVPQLSGQFAVEWKFRGHRPSERKLAERAPTLKGKASLPDMKLNSLPLSTIDPSPSSSSTSIQTTSTSTSSAFPQRPQSAKVSSFRGKPDPHMPKALSLPPSAIDQLRKDLPLDFNPPSGKKKESDPTPLRQSVAAESDPSLDISNPNYDEPEEDEDLLRGESEVRARQDSSGSGGSGSTSATGSGSGSSGGSGQAGRAGAGPPSVTDFAHAGSSRPSLEDGQRPLPRNGSAASTPPLSANRPPSAASSVSHLTVPTPKSSMGSMAPPPIPPAARSGNSPSLSSLVDPSLKDAYPSARRNPLSRQTSATSRTPSTSTTSTQGLNPLRRNRTLSGPSKPNAKATKRKGETPAEPLESHTCTWNFDIEHVIKIPLHKSTAVQSLKMSESKPSTPGSMTPTGRQPRPLVGPPAPVLGAGPMSESGLNLVIWQVPQAKKSDNVNQDVEPDSPQSSAVEKKQKGDGTETMRILLGMVDLDLAAFAGKGPTARKFLLKGSRTNATIRITVSMRWVGGEERWAAPPMQQGHHVTGIHDLVGTEAEDRIRGDLRLAKTSSGSSSDSTGTSAAPSQAGSTNPSRSHSRVDLVAAGPSHNYHSYEQHLLPRDALRPTGSGSGDGENRKSLSRSVSGRSSKSHKPHEHRHHHHSDHLMPTTPSSALTFSSSPRHRHHHHHHSQHIRGITGLRRDRIEHIPAELVIEAIFNPHPSTEPSPFTYVPKEAGALNLEGGQAVLEKVIAAAVGNEDPEKGSISTEGSRDKENVPGQLPDDASQKAGGEGRLGWGERMRARRERKASKKFARSVSTPVTAE